VRRHPSRVTWSVKQTNLLVTDRPLLSGACLGALSSAALDFVANLDQRMAQRMVQFNRWAMVIVAVAVPVFCVGSFLGGWWWGHYHETLEVQHAIDALPAASIQYSPGGAQQRLTLMANNDITKVRRDCQAVAGGGETCSYYLWSRLPRVPIP
jgi:hypothetical protein